MLSISNHCSLPKRSPSGGQISFLIGKMLILVHILKPPPPPIKAPSAVSAVGGDRARDGEGLERECTSETEGYFFSSHSHNSRLLPAFQLNPRRVNFRRNNGMIWNAFTGKRNALFRFLRLFFYLRDVGY